MIDDPTRQSDGDSVSSSSGSPRSIETLDENYDPGETLGRAMNLGCSLVLIAMALVSCGFIASVLTLHR